MLGARSTNELQWLDLKTAHHDSGASDGRQVNMSC